MGQGPYLHDGSAPTLGDAVNAHQTMRLLPADVTSLVSYLREVGVDEPATTTIAPPTGTSCAVEGGACVIPTERTATVYFGADGSFLKKSGVSSSLNCSVVNFGDPVFGVAKTYSMC